MTRAFLATLALVLYARLLFVSLTAIVIAPALHRMLHKLHLEETKDAER